MYKIIIKIIIFVLFLESLFCSCKSSLESSMKNYPANGTSSGRIIFSKSYFNINEMIRGPYGDTKSIKITSRKQENNKIIIYFKSTKKSGIVYFATGSGDKLYLTFYKNNADIDDDGFPDLAELNSETDRISFRKWFIRIAESQFLKRNFSWNVNERDCSGLIRYAYREALKKHDNKWQQKSGLVIDKNLRDVKKFNYPDVPIIKDKLFKVSIGPAFEMSTFDSFADADKLVNLNCSFISKDPQNGRPGDLLFFYDKDNVKFPYHSMIIAGFENKKLMVIYHTGGNDVLKRVPLSYLKKSISFYPDKWNKKFLGVFRFNILQ